MDESRELARWVANLEYKDLPQTVVEKTKDVILDQLGVELASSTKPWSKAVYRDAVDAGGKRDSTVVNYGDKLPVLAAAFVNGTFGHGFEIDDLYRPGLNHPACCVVPAALALGERELVSGKDIILAVAVGYEIMGRVGAAAAPTINALGHHPTSSTGPFGAVAAGAKILGFDARLTLHALGIAGSTCCGLGEFNQTGGQVGRIHGGLGASGGLRGVLLAAAGVTGPPTVIEGDHGFLQAFSNGRRVERLTANLGKSWVVLDIGFKLHANCALNHAPIDSLQKILARHPFKAEDVKQITILHNSLAPKVIGMIREPATVADAQFSGYYNLAMTVVLGSNGFRNYTDENLNNPVIRALSRKVRFQVGHDAEANFPQKRMGGVEVELTDGKTYREMTEYARGNPENPFTAKELRDKFRDLSSSILPSDRVEEIIKAIDSLEQVDSIYPLVTMLCA